jgi:hypothetical protein
MKKTASLSRVVVQKGSRGCFAKSQAERILLDKQENLRA